MNRKIATDFHDEWLKDERFSKCVMEGKCKTNARCSISEKDIDLSSIYGNWGIN